MRQIFLRSSLLFVLMFLDYLIVSLGIIALNSRLYWETAVADGVTLVLGFTTIKKIVEAKTKREMIGYTLGGIAGTQAAIFAANLWGW